jgi:16S rRNA A1518/A1519 N6-dimethyltransferase RsmA/KsgA/DIM1 with predicted DNA glycosylase/AP lyase activity
MIWLVVVLAVIIVSFGGVLLVGAPYLPTLTPQVEIALNFANLKPGQTLLELGCGDGKVLIAAAEQGISCVGYELNPILALVAWLRTRKYKGLVRVVWGDFWQKPWPEAEAIFVFLLAKYMQKLDTKIIKFKNNPVKLISFAFMIPQKEIAQEKQGVYLYLYD